MASKKRRKAASGKRRAEKTAGRVPVSAAAVRALGIEASTLADAESRLKTRIPLAKVLAKRRKLREAWKRGRFLRNLRGLAATAATIGEAADALEIERDRLKEMLVTDREAADVWNQARLETTIQVKRAMVEKAKAGSPAAAKQVESILRSEIARPSVDFRRLTIAEMVEVTGKTRQTLHDWHIKGGLPRNSDKTYSLVEFVPWLEEFAARKVARGPGKAALATSNPLAAIKAEKMEVDLQRQRGELLDRREVLAGQIARHQNLLNSLNRKNEELAMLCDGQDSAKIAQILQTFFEDVRAGSAR